MESTGEIFLTYEGPASLYSCLRNAGSAVSNYDERPDNPGARPADRGRNRLAQASLAYIRHFSMAASMISALVGGGFLLRFGARYGSARSVSLW